MDDHTRAELAKQLAEEMTVLSRAQLVDQDREPARGPMPMLMLMPSIQAHTFADSGEPVDLLSSSLLGRGFTLLSRCAPEVALDIAQAPAWPAVADPNRNWIRIGADGDALYTGEVGSAPLTGWHAAAGRWRELVVLIATAPADCDDVGVGLAEAATAGRLVGARVPLRWGTVS